MAIILCLTLMIVPGIMYSGIIYAVPASSDVELNKLKDSLEKAVADRKAAEKAYESAKEALESMTVRKRKLDAQIESYENELSAIEALISGYDDQINALTSRIGELKSALSQKRELLTQRLRANYEDGNVNYWEMIFTSDGLYEFLTQLDRIVYLLEYDEQIITEYDHSCEELDASLSSLISLKNEARDTQNMLIQSKQKLNGQLENMISEMATLDSDVNASYELYKKKIADEKEFNSDIEKLLAERQAQTNAAYVGGEFIWPLPSSHTYISSGFGWRIHPITKLKQFHLGIDIPAPYKTSIYAANSGTVIEQGYHNANGNYIIIDHGGGKATFYAHLTKILVATGQKVNQGDTVGLVGTTGWSTGYHLHFGVFVDNTAVDPTTYYNQY